MVEVFITNIHEKINALMLESWLVIKFPSLEFNSDMSEKEHVLRVQSKNSTIEHEQIIQFIESLGCEIQRLE